MFGDQEIVQRFLDTKVQVHPDVVRYIRDHEDPALIDRILADLPQDTVVVSARHIPSLHPERDGARFPADPKFEIVKGAAGSCGASSRFEDFVQYFRDRYTRLGEMIRGRMPAMPIEALRQGGRYLQQECSVIGMVAEVRTTTNGHRLVDLEDPTGTVSILFNKGRPVFAEAEGILPDEVIGVRGKLSSDGKLLFADQLMRPDIPVNHAPFQSETPGKAVLISDIHIGSDVFLEREWARFSEWMSQAEDVQYLLIAGDLVDGIGIYPGQEEELAIRDIYEQYRVLAGMMQALPRRIQVILSPGNHDVVRAAEPQPAIPPEFTGGFPDNCTFVENPCFLSVQKVGILLYHGRSIDDMIGLIPGASYARPEQMMAEMLQRRHLAPAYGRRTSIAAGRTDGLVIDPVPEVLHTGHVHTCGITRYRGVLGINAGTWQDQTHFQKQMNIHPTPARAVVLDLATLEPQVLDFRATVQE
ncbi:MAG: DNA-directed DNA polymerase II small subunit [Methanomicrobiales archaeon]|nr:DNA-directed DNA polymerase II small subunit [Methanomicrobiales archaeon]